MVAQMPAISVIMSALNAERTIETAIRSILWQTFTHWEFIVIDDGSTDSTRALVGNLRDPRIRLVPHSERRGLARRLNEAVSLARGTYIARMDADDIAYPERFALQHAFLQRYPDVDLVGAAIMAFRDDYRPVGVLRPPEDHASICADPELGFSLAHPTWMGRASFFKARPYNEAARRAQDQDLLLRTYTSAQFANVPQVLLGYRQESVSARNTIAGRLQYCRSMIEVWGHGKIAGRARTGVIKQAIRGAMTIPAIASGFGNYVINRRYTPPTDTEAEAWTAVLRQAQRP